MPTAVKAQKVDAAPCTVDSKLYLLHPGEAATWLAGGMYERQRPMRPYHTAFLRNPTPYRQVQAGHDGGHGLYRWQAHCGERSAYPARPCASGDPAMGGADYASAQDAG